MTNPDGAIAAAAKLALVGGNPGSGRMVREAVEEFHPDVAHVHNTWFTLTTSALRTLRAAGVPTVMTLHNYRYSCLNGQLLRDGAVCELCVGRGPSQGVRYRCYRDALPSSLMAAVGVTAAHRSWPNDVDRFVVMTEFAKAKFVSAGLPGDRFIVKPHHVADPGPRPAPPHASNTVLFVGRIAPEKGVDVLVDAWRDAALEGYELVIVGDGPLRTTLEAAAPRTVRFTGWLPASEVRQRMLEARLLAFPSVWYETFGLAMVEAMAAGTPVIASDLGGTPELIGTTTPGALVAAADIAGWSESLRSIVPDSEWIDRAGAAARMRYEDAFTAARALNALEAIYKSAISSRT